MFHSIISRFRGTPGRKSAFAKTKSIKNRCRPLLEPMEERALPSVAPPAPGTPGPLTLTGTNGPDQFVIRLQAGAATNIQVSDNGGSSFTTAALADVTGINVDGLGGKDSLTVDNSNGLVAKAGTSTSYQAKNLVSDQPGLAPITDANLVNGWGIALNP